MHCDVIMVECTVLMLSYDGEIISRHDNVNIMSNSYCCMNSACYDHYGEWYR